MIVRLKKKKLIEFVSFSKKKNKPKHKTPPTQMPNPRSQLVFH